MRGFARWGAAVLVLGFLTIVAGVAVLVPRGPECGGQTMEPGDRCVHTSVGGGGARTSTTEYHRREGGNRFAGGALIAVGIGLAGLAVVRGRGVARSRRGELTVRARVTVSADEAVQGTTRDVTFTARRRCGACGGRGHTAGAKNTLLCGSCGTTGLDGRHRRTLHVRIPAGVRNATLLRVAGGGHAGGAAGPDGDLLLRVRVPAPRRGKAAPKAGGTGAASTGIPGHAPSASPPRRSPRPSSAPSPGTGASPRLVTVQRDGVRFTADGAGITVEVERRSPRGVRWQTRAAHTWRDIALLVFDSDRSDPVVALYVVPPGTSGVQARSHLVDARAFTESQWERIAAGVGRASAGQVALDLRGRTGGRSPRDG
ncbi:DnaJ C-terminal domain-containing protein [Streptomyces sp. NBC_00859]|uniref:DnaJ C-terminal domain-containing protein n=1 Tax=Streptomyces sp. NBC_00859 TaxID=2903682 RepID=UPI0038671EDF|nr:hypothetical protein OG584_01955 [Streptomyces sp. NBC_00859]